MRDAASEDIIVRHLPPPTAAETTFAKAPRIATIARSIADPRPFAAMALARAAGMHAHVLRIAAILPLKSAVTVSTMTVTAVLIVGVRIVRPIRSVSVAPRNHRAARIATAVRIAAAVKGFVCRISISWQKNMSGVGEKPTPLFLW